MKKKVKHNVLELRRPLSSVISFSTAATQSMIQLLKLGTRLEKKRKKLGHIHTQIVWSHNSSVYSAACQDR